jgi:hypothetical protein
LDSPNVSEPNTTATGPLWANASISGAAWRGVKAGCGRSRRREVQARQGRCRQERFSRLIAPRRFQHIHRAGGPGACLVVDFTPGIDQGQVGQAHHFHGPRHRAQIAGMAGFQQDDTDFGEKGSGVQGKIRPEFNALWKIMHPMLNIAVKAARAAGVIINRAVRRPGPPDGTQQTRKRLRQRGRPASRAGHHR